MATSSRSLAHSLSLLLGAGALVACSSEPAPNSGTGGVGTGGSSAGMAPSGGAGSPSAGSSASGSASGGESGAGVSGGAAGGGAGGTGGTGGSGGAISDKIHDVAGDGDGKITVGPDYEKDPDLEDQQNPVGKSFQFTMKAADYEIFKGTDPTLSKPVTNQDWGRGIEVYVPAQYKDGAEAPLLVIQEGQLGNVKRALDNLTISTDPMKKLPAFVAIAVANGSQRDGSDGKGSERGLEYDTMSDRYTKFIDTEVIPAVLANQQIKAAFPNFKLTSDPFGRATMGCSSGGAAALSMGWFGGTFQRIITYSGTFVTQQNAGQEPESTLYPMGAWDYHSNKELIKNNPRKPLRVFIHASEDDNGSTQPADNGRNWVEANERTHTALEAKDYHHRYVYSLATGHCDGRVFDLTLAQTLSWVWRGYPTQ